MKAILPEQKTLIDIITKDQHRIPKFVDCKNQEHHQAFLVMQQVYDWLIDLASDFILTDEWVERMYWVVDGELKKIKEPLRKKFSDYITKKMKYYLDTAIEFELYETACNYRNFLQP